jgi:acetyl-CoA synthetase
MAQSWTGQNRLFDTYFSQYPGYYFTGDGARGNEDVYI